MSNNYKNYEKAYSSPERKKRLNHNKVIRNFALVALLATGIITGANKLAAAANPIDYDSDGVSFRPNGGIPELYFHIEDYSFKKDSAGRTTYESDNGAKGVKIFFDELDKDQKMTIEEGGSFRSSPIAADIDKVSTILLSKQDMVLENVDKIGHCVTSGDNFYMIDYEDAPADVKEYISEKDVQLTEIEGKKYIFISYLDADIVNAKSLK